MSPNLLPGSVRRNHSTFASNGFWIAFALILKSTSNNSVKINRIALRYKGESDPMIYEVIFNDLIIREVKLNIEHSTSVVASGLASID